ncbi:unnamed protein product, partial [Tetraodon nigroviridis]
MARRTGFFQKNTAPKANQSIKQFLPVPGSVKHSIAPVSAPKQLNSRPKHTEKVDNERMSRRVVFMSEETQSASMGDIINEDEMGHSPSLSQSRYERMHEQYNNLVEEEDHWQDELARWKNRRRSASQELIRKEEERKRMEKRLKEEGSDTNKRKSIKTYKEIVEDKERREAELCEAYKNAASPEEAAVVLQRYALRFTISDATLDSLKVPRAMADLKQDTSHMQKEQKMTAAGHDSETPAQPKAAQPEDMETKATAGRLPSSWASSSPVTKPDSAPPQSLELQPCTTESPNRLQKQAIPEETWSQITQVQPSSTQPAHTLPSPSSATPRPVPLLAAKPYRQPRNSQPGHKPVKVSIDISGKWGLFTDTWFFLPAQMDGLVRVNGEVMEDPSVSAAVGSSQSGPQEIRDLPPVQKEDLPPAQPATKEETEKQRDEKTPAPQTDEKTPAPQRDEKTRTKDENLTTFSGSAISSLLGVRNCVTTTTIVTELTQTRVEPHNPPAQSGGQQVNSAAVLPERPAEGKNSLQDYSPTVAEGLEEASMTIETPMLNLAKRVNHWVWDPNEERKRLESWQQEQERLLQEQYRNEQEKLKKEWEKAQLEVEEEERKHIEEVYLHMRKSEKERRILEETVTHLTPTGLACQQSGQTAAGSPGNSETVTGNAPLQVNGHRAAPGKEDQHASKLHFFLDSASDVKPLKKQELWKTASLDRNPQLNQAQVCGVCNGQLGDTTTGTDVRIRNGLLSCYECYIASRG